MINKSRTRSILRIGLTTFHSSFSPSYTSPNSITELPNIRQKCILTKIYCLTICTAVGYFALGKKIGDSVSHSCNKNSTNRWIRNTRKNFNDESYWKKKIWHKPVNRNHADLYSLEMHLYIFFLLLLWRYFFILSLVHLSKFK